MGGGAKNLWAQFSEIEVLFRSDLRSSPTAAAGHAQADGGPASAAFFGDRSEIAQTAEVHSRHAEIPCHTDFVWVRCSMVLDLKSTWMSSLRHSILGTLAS
jgi:hypothetical protein